MRNRGSAGSREFVEYFGVRRDLVRRTAYLLCGDWHLADDLTQITFVRLAASWNKVRDPQALDAFVRTCLIRVYLAETRRVWRRRERSDTAAPEPSIGDQTDHIAGRLTIMDAMRKLAPRQRAVLVCRFYQDLDVNETADVLGCSSGTVKSQTARALTALRGHLAHDAQHIVMDEVTR